MTVTRTTSALDRLPTELLTALDCNPDDFALRGAIADYLYEIGETEAAECLRWSVEKGRVPNYPGGTWDCYLDRPNAHLPDQFYGTRHTLLRENLYSIPVLCWYRCVRWWLNSTPDEREKYWQWTP